MTQERHSPDPWVAGAYGRQGVGLMLTSSLLARVVTSAL
jgi:hypothetical protein